ncbi:MAG: efflux RND transporter periplasmic adaptor subunit, partial [Kiritimatiellaeota bacterium]|nr:efflux RND transporter periplasmic adaptor subunit [Kiritimatiellota bacterium]
SAQAEYVQALGVGGGEALQQSATRKLKFFDFTDAQIVALEKSRTPQKTVPVLAPADGVVVEKMAVVGQMVEAGMRLYRLADLGLVWVQAQIYERDLAFVKLGQEATVTLSYLPDRHFRGRVTYVYPNVDEKTRTAKVRMEFHNPGYLLKPGMFAEVQLVSELEPATLLVPEMAVLRSGEQNTVFVALDGGRFDPRAVQLGATAEDGRVQLLDGLKEGERIVTSGQFMLDSESQLREAIQKMQQPGGTAPVSAPTSISAHQTSTASSSVKYICPMPEHVSIEYDHAGPCPLCGMALVPVTSADLAKLPPGGKLLYYTCPMPEHASVHEAKPGKCPLCGLTLIPVMSAPIAPTKAAVAPTLYTCPMASHADVVSDKPGQCPKCEMDLVPTSTVTIDASALPGGMTLSGGGTNQLVTVAADANLTL